MPCYPASIDLVMTLDTFPPNSAKTLHRWRVLEVSRGNIRTRHVCGENPTGNMGISTSAIQEFDPVDMTVKTRSGKIYVLVGQPDNTRLAEGAWRTWCKDNGVVAERDVTSEYLNADQAPTITFKRLNGRPGSLLISPDSLTSS